MVSTTSGYTGGQKRNPTYEEVSAGGTGHAEAVRVVYDPAKVTYEHLLEVFWHNIDPLARDRQFCDAGNQYRSAIFYARRGAAAGGGGLEGRPRGLGAAQGTRSRPRSSPPGEFWPAEEYHQDYYRKNPIRYRYYRGGCGRDSRLKEIWGDDAGH